MNKHETEIMEGVARDACDHGGKVNGLCLSCAEWLDGHTAHDFEGGVCQCGVVELEA